MIYGYIRISSKKQNEERQITALLLQKKMIAIIQKYDTITLTKECYIKER